MSDSGQAFTEYTLVMVALVSLVFITGAATNLLYDGAFIDLLRGFGIYSDNFDYVLSFPFP